jgi:hypothetical protein
MVVANVDAEPPNDLAKNGNSYRSKGTSEFFNPDGSVRPPVLGCSESTATRFR